MKRRSVVLAFCFENGLADRAPRVEVWEQEQVNGFAAHKLTMGVRVVLSDGVEIETESDSPPDAAG